MDGADVLVFSDFNYGCLPQSLVEQVIPMAKSRSVMLAADSQSSSQVGDISRFREMDLLTPTEREARISTRNREDGLVVLAEQLRQQSSAKNILLKLGEEGLLIHAGNGKGDDWLTDRIGALNTSPKDVAGAGDSLLITSALTLIGGGNIWEAAYLGSRGRRSGRKGGKHPNSRERVVAGTNVMRAILLAAGYGTRLRPLTNTIPKCLVPINGRPLLEIWLERLTDAGIGPCLINTHFLAEQVDEFVRSSRYRDKVTLVHEERLLGTAGTLIANLDYFRLEDGLLIHADNYCLADFTAFAEAHVQRPADCVMTMMTFRSDSPSSCGIVELDEDGVVVGFHEKVSSPPPAIWRTGRSIYSLRRLSRGWERICAL